MDLNIILFINAVYIVKLYSKRVTVRIACAYWHNYKTRSKDCHSNTDEQTDRGYIDTNV